MVGFSSFACVQDFKVLVNGRARIPKVCIWGHYRTPLSIIAPTTSLLQTFFERNFSPVWNNAEAVGCQAKYRGGAPGVSWANHVVNSPVYRLHHVDTFTSLARHLQCPMLTSCNYLRPWIKYNMTASKKSNFWHCYCAVLTRKAL